MTSPDHGRAFDVVTVPDFAGDARQIFEGRTLLFLASWMENAGAARDLPLHIACIGEPPESVRRMADRAGALLSVHEPVVLANAHTANKLRGLEVERRTHRLLIVDTDIVFLGDISALRNLPDCVSAAAGGGARVPIKLWRRLYAELGLDFPDERTPLLRAALGMPPVPDGHERFEHQNTESAASPPYFNSGVVFAAWKHSLRSLWADCLEHGARVVAPSELGSDGVLRSDQSAFALAVATLRSRGVEFRPLPDAMHTRWRHLYRGRPKPAEIRILHTTGMMTGRKSADGLVSKAPLDAWCEKTRSRLTSVFRADVQRGQPLAGLRRLLRGRRFVGDIHRRLLAIYHRQIDGVL